MASVAKFDMGAVPNQLRHNERLIANPSNPDIDPERSSKNYSLLAPREISSYDYFLERKAELYCYNRADIKVMASWIVTAPIDLAQEQEDLFFEKTNEFLQKRYGAENAIQSIVHYDEGGQPHLHYVFIPVTEDLRHGGEKICANEVLTRKELRCFHPALQKYLNEAGVDCNIMTGITQEIGGSISVKDLKKAERLIEHKRGFSW